MVSMHMTEKGLVFTNSETGFEKRHWEEKAVGLREKLKEEGNIIPYNSIDPSTYTWHLQVGTPTIFTATTTTVGAYTYYSVDLAKVDATEIQEKDSIKKAMFKTFKFLNNGIQMDKS